MAIKVLHASQNAPDELARMAAEARAAQRVASFCTARILRVRLEPPRPYIVSEYIDGLSLQATVDGGDGRPGRRFAGDDLHRLGIGIATALTAIHQAKVVHRDLKPGNVMLGPDGPRLIDFGIARVLDSGTATGGGFVGTLRYMAPEVYAGQRADAEADVFAWGAIMVFAATGEHAFTGGSLPEIAHRIRTHHPDLSMLPERLRPLVAAALAKDPLDRPPARAILAALTEDPREGTGDLHGLVAAGAAQAGLHSRWEPGDPALGKVAEDAYVSLPPQERMLVPEVFLRCLVPGEDGTVSTRPVPAAELFDRQDPAEVQALRRVVGAFPRLLTVTGQGPDEQIVLTRPAVLRAWPRLRSWVAYEGENLAVHHRIRQAARTWADHGRRRSDVLTGAHLDEAVRRATAADRRPVLNQLERGLLDASTRAQAVRSRRVRAVALVLAVTTVLSLAATGWAVRAQQATARQRDIAASRQLAAQSRQFGATRPDMAALLAAAAYRIRRTPESRAALQNIVTGSSRGVLTGYRAHDVAADRTGRYLAIGETDGRTALWDVRAHRQIGRLPRLFSPKGQKSVPASVALSPDGKTLAVSSVESSDGRPVQGRMQLYRVPSLQPFGRPVPVASPYAMVFTSDGGGVAVDDGTAVTVWDVRTQKQRGPRVQYPRGVDTNVLLAPGTVAASSLTEEETFVLQVWDLATGRSTGPFPVPGEAVALSPDGRTVAAQEYKEDDTEHVYVSLWDTRTGRRLGNRVRAPAGAELFSPDGRIVFIGTEPWATARVIRIGSIAPENQESMSFAAFVGERTVASIDDDSKMVRLWDVTVHQPDRSPFRTEPTPVGRRRRPRPAGAQPGPAHPGQLPPGVGCGTGGLPDLGRRHREADAPSHPRTRGLLPPGPARHRRRRPRDRRRQPLRRDPGLGLGGPPVVQAGRRPPGRRRRHGPQPGRAHPGHRRRLDDRDGRLDRRRQGAAVGPAQPQAAHRTGAVLLRHAGDRPGLQPRRHNPGRRHRPDRPALERRRPPTARPCDRSPHQRGRKARLRPRQPHARHRRRQGDPAVGRPRTPPDRRAAHRPHRQGDRAGLQLRRRHPRHGR
ncbi:hypothetical protein GCM10022416_55810 [Actinomadura keratinilytica]|uniref:non-specific serine/threonine protein kinase n=1 Tax=Actinomadura keratinilytica TaxID=547461 RepID=A0ABP7ZEU2_9ACTN